DGGLDRGPDGLLTQPGDEGLDHVEGDVGLEERDADVAERLVDQLRGDFLLPGQPVLGRPEALGDCFQHGREASLTPGVGWRGPASKIRSIRLGRQPGEQRSRAPLGPEAEAALRSWTAAASGGLRPACSASTMSPLSIRPAATLTERAPSTRR